MKINCPNLNCKSTCFYKDGTYYRKSDYKHIKRYRCKLCKKRFSQASFCPEYGQKKRQLNSMISTLLSSNMSQRRIAKVLKINVKTVARKLIFLGKKCKSIHFQSLKDLDRKFEFLQFDDLETIEHTKCKPLSVSMIVEDKTRKIINFKVSKIPSKGLLAAISRKKYGIRPDERKESLDRLFREIKPYTKETATFYSDKHCYYPKPVKTYFPQSAHITTKGARGCIAGQGELKKLYYDPLFSLNHTFAMLRANINRLIRKTWNTTKKIEALNHHLWIYVDYHNNKLTTA
jgi:transposase-like protein